MKRSILFVTATVLASSCLSVTSFGADFYDINDVPWEGAKPYINKVADLNLMVGDIHPKTGKPRFRAKENVSYCETTQLAYNCLKKTGKLTKSDTDLVAKWTHVLKSFNIPDWAYESVAYALENEVLSLTDVSRFMKKDGSKIVNGYASRESVAVIFGKMLKGLYTVNNDAQLTFLDKGSISATSVPYVDLLSRLGILVGDTDNNFTPKTYINRAEMAVLTSKTYEALNGGITPDNTNKTPVNPAQTDGTISGTITSIEDYGDNKILAVTTSDGKQQGFTVNSSTYIVKGNTAEQVNLSQLKKDMQVSIDYSDTKVNVIRVTSEITAAETEEKGIVDELTPQKIYLRNSSDKIVSFYLNDRCEFVLDSKSKTMKEVFDAFEDNGMEAVLTVDYQGNVTKAVLTTTEAAAYTGELVSIDKEELNYKEKSGAKVQSYEWSTDPTIEYEGKTSTIGKIEDYAVKNTLYVKFYLDSRDRIKKLFVSEDKYSTGKDSGDTVTASIVSWSDSGKLYVKRLSNKDKETYTTDDDTKYYVDGASSTERELMRDYRKADNKGDNYYVKIVFDKDKDVVKLYGSSSKSSIDGPAYSKEYDGTLVFLTNTQVKIDDGSQRPTYSLSGDIEYYLEGKSSTNSAVNKAFDDEKLDNDDLYVTLYVDDDKEVVKIDASTKETSGDRSGTIKSMTSDVIRLNKNGTEYDLASDVSIKWDDAKISLSDFRDKVDDDDLSIKAKLTVKNGKVSEIRAYTERAYGDLYKISNTDKTIKIETRDDKYEFVVESRGVTCTGDETDFKKLETAFDDGDEFKIELTFNDDGEVEKINNTKR